MRIIGIYSHSLPPPSPSHTDAPIVSLSLGSNLDPKNLAKGTDVYLECRIEANPPVKKIEWYHNNKPLQPTRGVIITNQSLVLQSISKQTHGQYMCRASNTQGSVSSNDLYLDIKCEFLWTFSRMCVKCSHKTCRLINYFIFIIPNADPPMCLYEGKVIRAALKQILNVTCDIDSNPLVSFSRAFRKLIKKLFITKLHFSTHEKAL